MNAITEMNIDELSLHAEALTTPRMGAEQFEALKADIDMHGQLDPATLYRGKIVDGRHRYLILKELGVTTMKVVKMANNSTIADIKAVVRSKETRRHETASQLAVTAYRMVLESGGTVSQAAAAKLVGANKKRVGEAKQIDVTYKRPDILELVFNGGKFNTGTEYIPFMSDSLGTILRWLGENKAPAGTDTEIGIDARDELTEDEQIIINKYVAAAKDESKLVLKELATRLYILTQEAD